MSLNMIFRYVVLCFLINIALIEQYAIAGSASGVVTIKGAVGQVLPPPSCEITASRPLTYTSTQYEASLNGISAPYADLASYNEFKNSVNMSPGGVKSVADPTSAGELVRIASKQANLDNIRFKISINCNTAGQMSRIKFQYLGSPSNNSYPLKLSFTQGGDPNADTKMLMLGLTYICGTSQLRWLDYNQLIQDFVQGNNYSLGSTSTTCDIDNYYVVVKVDGQTLTTTTPYSASALFLLTYI